MSTQSADYGHLVFQVYSLLKNRLAFDRARRGSFRSAKRSEQGEHDHGERTESVTRMWQRRKTADDRGGGEYILSSQRQKSSRTDKGCWSCTRANVFSERADQCETRCVLSWCLYPSVRACTGSLWSSIHKPAMGIQLAFLQLLLFCASALQRNVYASLMWYISHMAHEWDVEFNPNSSWKAGNKRGR